MIKKAVVLTSIFCVLLSVLCACKGKDDEKSSEETTQATLPPPYTTVVDGEPMTAQKLGSSDKDYEVGCYDENGRGTRFEYYKDGKLSYYYVSSDFDETGNESVQTYFNADGKLLASIKDGQFYDADGKVISEYQMEEFLKKYK